ncbi:XRE family transcriptional regulator [Cohnella silvisoli]|uniref:XRE family transcriptional regulator n=1 Tax=Cohnella silvisoli TaxID=2873699 RepID=A0ABV1L257_9BACL|nr:XRE family transcriptional regulator [Cohnella silvisoli]MCD9025780.1 XRE family transcriptional regulator [Cohnella silvisoli]
MARKMPITSFGWAIKERLAALKMDQRRFCEENDIPQSRLAELISGSRKATRYRKKVETALGLSFPERQAK